MRSLQQFWSVRRIGEDRVTLARLGPLRLWLARADREWGYACDYGEEIDLMDFAQVPEDVVPEKLKWTSILFRDAPRDYLFEAIPPMRPVTVRTVGVLGLPAGESCSFYLIVPAFIRIRVLSNGSSQLLGTIASQKIRQSWFGSLTDGIHAYANPVDLLLDSRQLTACPNQIVYPVEMKNNSNKMLRFDQLCLDLRNTGLYSGATHLWGSPVGVEFLGHSRECPVSCSDAVPDTERELIEVAAPRKSQSHELARLVISCCHLM